MKAALIIPALNEEASIGRTLSSLPAGVYSEVLVVDNGSADATARIAAELGAKVVSERRVGTALLAWRALRPLHPTSRPLSSWIQTAAIGPTKRPFSWSPFVVVRLTW